MSADRHAPVSILMIEDDTRLAEALAPRLSAEGLEVSFEATGAAGLARAKRQPPDVVFLDLGLPDIDGVALIPALRAAGVLAPVVVLTVATAESRILAAIRAGARGYLFKEDIGERLIAAVDEALSGGAPMSRAVARLVIETLSLAPGREARQPQPTPLTARELETVQLLAEGCTYEQVAAAMDISVNTVRAHVRAIYEKLAVGTKTEAVMAAMRLGLVRRPG